MASGWPWICSTASSLNLLCGLVRLSLARLARSSARLSASIRSRSSSSRRSRVGSAALEFLCCCCCTPCGCMGSMWCCSCSIYRGRLSLCGTYGSSIILRASGFMWFASELANRSLDSWNASSTVLNPYKYLYPLYLCIGHQRAPNWQRILPYWHNELLNHQGFTVIC